MLETVRQYAQERLSETDDGAEVRTRHLRYCVALAEAAEPHLTGAEQGMWMARLQSEQEDLLAAHTWCSCATEDAALGLRLAEVHRAQGQFSAAQACYEESLAVGRELGNAGITAIVACNLARLLVAAGDHAGARTRLLECQAIAGAAGLKGLGEDWLEVAASLAVAVGDHASGARLHGASLARMQEAGARREAVDAAFIQPLMDEARATLGAAAFDAAERAGRALNFDASMLALKAWLERPAPR